MSHHPHAILYYGFNLSDGIAWALEEAGEYGDLVLPWMRTGDESADERERPDIPEDDDGDDDDGDAADFITQAKARLVALAPPEYANTDPDAVLREHYGVSLTYYDYYSDRTYYLATHVVEITGDHKPWLVSAKGMVMRPETERWDDKLRVVLDALQITPTQALPSWVLHAYMPG
ncbi:hypothetical protein AB0F17_34205 [Nonomuraea sp. NPDC026600]|uniref:hypothetical protein n=1 Tax=Nonomuraea sp. NPDC026600 TaxID=3155363 RepID=UPI0033DCA985